LTPPLSVKLLEVAEDRIRVHVPGAEFFFDEGQVGPNKG
jgi:hypothetical protein